MRIQLIALDLDGTLIGSSMTIPERNRRAIQAAMEAGCYVTIATGRAFEPTVRYARDLGLNAPLILHQGALIQDHRDGSVIHRQTMLLPIAREVAAFAVARQLVMQIHLSNGRSYVERANQLDPGLRSITGIMSQPVDHIDQWLDQPPLKLLFLQDPARMPGLVRELRRQFDNRVQIVQSHSHIVEITDNAISKGNGLARLANPLGIAREGTMAMGDHDNDASMLSWAGIGIAMHDASPAARAAADLIAPRQVPVRHPGGAQVAVEPHDEAVAWAIKRYVLAARG
jgi:Cof subfamily protein (haloacid dehalogenase superfamily)